MDVDNLSHVIKRLKPFIRDQTIQRGRFERALTAMKIPDVEVRLEIERLLLEAGFIIEIAAPTPDSVDQGVVRATAPPVQHELRATDIPSDDPDESAIAAARRRIERDRYTRDPAKALLRPEEEVGLALLVRGRKGLPLEAGAYATLEGEPKLAARALLLHNQRLVRWVAQRYSPSGMEYEDLFQHGVIGLIRAIELFDPAHGAKFSTYAVIWVRQAITRAIANESRLIRIPVHMVERINKVWATRSRLTENGRLPTHHELALACGLTDKQTSECLAMGPQDILSLDMPVGSQSESTLGDLLDIEDSDSRPERQVEFQMMKHLIDDVLSTLSEREARVIRLRYGLVDGEQWTLEQIGNAHGLTRERIRQIETKTLSKLRHPVRSSQLKEFL